MCNGSTIVSNLDTIKVVTRTQTNTEPAVEGQQRTVIVKTLDASKPHIVIVKTSETSGSSVGQVKTVTVKEVPNVETPTITKNSSSEQKDGVKTIVVTNKINVPQVVGKNAFALIAFFYWQCCYVLNVPL